MACFNQSKIYKYKNFTASAMENRDFIPEIEQFLENPSQYLNAENFKFSDAEYLFLYNPQVQKKFIIFRGEMKILDGIFRSTYVPFAAF